MTLSHSVGKSIKLLQRIGEAYYALLSFGWLSRWLSCLTEGRPYVTAGVIGSCTVVFLWLRFIILDRHRRGIESDNLLPEFCKYLLQFVYMVPLAIILAIVFWAVVCKVTQWRQR